MISLKKLFMPALCAACMSLASSGALAAWDGPNVWDEPWPWEVDFSRPAAAQPCDPAPVEQTTQPGQPDPATTTVPADSADLLSLGQSLCAAGLNADIDALLGLMEPVSFNMMMEMMSAFTTEGEEGLNSVEAFKAEFRAEMKEKPLLTCVVADSKTTECDLEKLADLTILGMPAPEACGEILMRSQQTGDSDVKDDLVNAVKVNGRWHIVFF
jgi:hypothetical protein